jgi:hypothetical protein
MGSKPLKKGPVGRPSRTECESPKLRSENKTRLTNRSAHCVATAALCVLQAIQVAVGQKRR